MYNYNRSYSLGCASGRPQIPTALLSPFLDHPIFKSPQIWEGTAAGMVCDRVIPGQMRRFHSPNAVDGSRGAFLDPLRNKDLGWEFSGRVLLA